MLRNVGLLSRQDNVISFLILNSIYYQFIHLLLIFFINKLKVPLLLFLLFIINILGSVSMNLDFSILRKLAFLNLQNCEDAFKTEKDM